MTCNCIRVNQTMFSGSSNINSYASGKEVVNVKLPSVSSTEGSHKDSENPVLNPIQFKDDFQNPHFQEKIPDLVTLSLLPKSQWQSLINLDIIKVLLLHP